MNEAGRRRRQGRGRRGTRTGRLFFYYNSTFGGSLSNLDGMSAVDSCFFMALEVSLVSYTAMVNEALSA
jgi:hypothetical protein